MKKTFFRYMTILIGIGGLAACGLPEEQSPLIKHSPDAGPGVSSEAGSAKIMPVPVLDPTPSSVCVPSVAVQGKATPGASVFAMGGAFSAGITTDANSTTGRFCMDVQLQPNTENTIEVHAFDPVLGTSAPVVITVLQTSCEEEPELPLPEEAEAKNVALGIQVLTSRPAEGKNTNLTDGDPSTTLVIQDGVKTMVSSADEWVRIRLDKVYMIDKIIVTWRDSRHAGTTSFATKYQLLVSAMSDPGDPAPQGSGWTTITTVEDGNGATDEFELQQSQPLAQDVALWLQADDSYWGGDEFALAEIEIMVRPKAQTPTNSTAQSGCSAGGAGY